jgi:hypothetical protein
VADEAHSTSAGAAELDRLAREGRENPLADHPRLRAFFECWLDTFVFEGRIDPLLRERVILRIMWRCAQPFEWGNHYRLARRVGLSDDDVLAVRTDDLAGEANANVAVVLRAADEMVDLGQLTEHTLDACRALFPDPGTLHEFLYLVAGYRMMASVSASTRTERGGPQWPPDGVGPVRG